MAERALVRQGDRTTHGGTVLTGDSTFIVEGSPVARVGDSVSCPLCKKIGKIVTGAPTMFDGQLVARHDDLTDCGAKLIAGQSASVYGDGSESSATATLATMPQTALGPEEQEKNEGIATPGEAMPSSDDVPHGIRFQAVDPETKTPIPKCVYIVTREDGTQQGGLTDREGFTAVIATDNQEQVAVHFAFTSPVGEPIGREDLS